MLGQQMYASDRGRLLKILVVVAMGLAAVMALGAGVSYARLSAEADATVSFAPAEASVYRGQTVEVMVEIDGAGALKGFDFELSWDDSVVEVLDVAPMGGFAATENFTAVIGTDSLFFGAVLLDGSTTQGELAVVTMRAPVGSDAGRSVLDLSQVLVVDAASQAVDVTVEDGAVTSIAADISPAYPQDWKGVGDTFTEMVRVHGAAGVRAFEFQFSWDETKVELVDVVTAGEFAGTELTKKIIGTNMVEVAGALTTVASGTGDLVEITLKALAPASPTDLTLSDVFIGEADFTTQELSEDALGQGQLYISDSAVWIDPSVSKVMEQDTFSVEVWKSTEAALSAFELNLVFDPAKVEFIGVGPTADIVGGGIVTGSLKSANVVGVYGVGLGGTLVPGGSAAMAEITFRAIEEGMSELDVLDAAEAEGLPYDPVLLADTSFQVLPAPEVQDGVVDATKRAVAFNFAAIGELQVVDVPFGVTIRAVTEDGDTAHYFGTADLSDDTGTISPDVATFTDGIAALDVTISDPQPDVTITANATDPITLAPITGESNAFDVCQPVEILALTSDSPVELGEPMHFTATVEGSEPISYTWDFGDDEAGELLAGGEETGTYLFDTYGTFTVTLTVENACGTDTETLVVDVTCEPAEITELTSDSSVELGEPMHFTATVEGTEPIAYTWDFGDDEAGELLAGGAETGTYLFAEAGTYTVTLTVENACGTDTETLVVEVSEVCEPVEITALTSDSPVTLGEPMHFTATVAGTEPIAYTWDFGDEGAGELLAGGEETGTYLFAEAGTYTVTLTVENACDTDTITLEVVVEEDEFKIFLPIVVNNYGP